MTLRQKQSKFVWYIALLIDQAYNMGYEITFGEAWRSPEEAARLARLGKGVKNSNHTKRLAIDLNLFKNGVYLTKTSDYKKLGEWWEAHNEAAPKGIKFCWGGRFGDGNHFSFEHNGVK